MSNITDISDSSALDTLRLLQPKTYNYIDTTNRTSDTVYGFIAQEVQTVLPYAVKQERKEIPNIYQNAKITKNTIVFTNFDTSLLEKDSNNNLYNTIKLRTSSNEFKYVQITSVTNSNTIEVNYVTEEVAGTVYQEEDIFVHGQLVDNFLNVSKDYIWTVATAALQEVDTQLQAEKAKRAEIESRLDAITAILQNNNLT